MHGSGVENMMFRKMVVQEHECTANAVQDNVVLKKMYRGMLHTKCCTEKIVQGNILQGIFFKELLYRQYFTGNVELTIMRNGLLYRGTGLEYIVQKRLYRSWCEGNCCAYDIVQDSLTEVDVPKMLHWSYLHRKR